MEKIPLIKKETKLNIVIPKHTTQNIRSVGEMRLLSNTKVTTRTSNFTSLYNNKTRKLKKVLVIVEEDDIVSLNKLVDKIQRGKNYQIRYILTNSEKIARRFWTFARVYPLDVNLNSILRYDVIDEIICYVSQLPENFILNLERTSCIFGIQLNVFNVKKNPSSYIREETSSKIENAPLHHTGYTIKKLLEFIFSATVVIVFSWLFLLIALLVKLSSPGPVIFKQLRVGLHGRKFWIYKFRTMQRDAEERKASLIARNQADGPMFKIANDPRITKIGKFLRKSNLDELPQLINVVNGDMALIGPRPMLPEEVDAQSEWQLKRFSVKPGITGLWQIQPNRTELPFNKWMALDNEYVETWSFKNDFILLIKTIWIVLQANGK